MKIPNFQWKNDVEAYLEWEMIIDQIFTCHEYSQEKKISLASITLVEDVVALWEHKMNARENKKASSSNLGRNERGDEEYILTTLL